MTARPMTEGERARILRWAQMFVADCADRGVPPLHTSGDATLDLARALLSSSAAERAVREELVEELEKARVEICALVPMPFEGKPDFSLACPNEADRECLTNALAAIQSALSSARAGEDEQEQARSPSALSASTDRLQSKE